MNSVAGQGIDGVGAMIYFRPVPCTSTRGACNNCDRDLRSVELGYDQLDNWTRLC